MLSLSKILELFRQCGICFSVYYIYIICRKSEINHHLYICIFVGGYFVMHCTRCAPCHVNSPSCAGYPDGKNIHSYKGAPFYMVCDTGRLMTTGLCNGKYIIDYSCYDKPCSKKLNVRYGTGHCDSYIWCYYGREFTYQCPAGTVFDKRRGSCQHKYDTCKPCGTQTW